MKQKQYLTAVRWLVVSSLALSPMLASAKVEEKKPQLIPIDPICQLNVDECGDPYEPPQIAPSTPKKITVSRQQGSGTVTVKWKPGSAGSGTNFRYELVRQVKNQSGSLVYSGTTAARTLNAGTNQAVRFQIRACNSAGCSSYKSSDYFLINGQYNNGGATTAPLEQMSQSTTLALKSTAGEYRIMGESDTAAAVLGNGFDALKGEVYGNSCWNTTGLDKIDSVQNVNEQKYSFRQVDSYESLATSLDIKRSGGGSLSFGGISFHAYFLSSEVLGFPHLAV